MKWTYTIPQKMQTAILLFCVMLSVVLFAVIERHNVARINSFVTSIHNDRLVPATAIFHLTSHLYNKHFAMEEFLATEVQDVARVKANLASHDENIAALIRQFDQTYLVEDESIFLKEFKATTQNHRQLEREVFTLSETNSKDAGRALYASKGKRSLDATMRELSELTTVQATVGSQLLKDTRGVLAISNLLSMLQIVLVLVIGKMIFSLISASKIMRPGRKNSHLN